MSGHLCVLQGQRDSQIKTEPSREGADARENDVSLLPREGSALSTQADNAADREEYKPATLECLAKARSTAPSMASQGQSAKVVRST